MMNKPPTNKPPNSYQCVDSDQLLFFLKSDYEIATRRGYRAMWQLYTYYTRVRDKLALLQEEDKYRRTDWGMYKKSIYMTWIIEDWLRN